MAPSGPDGVRPFGGTMVRDPETLRRFEDDLARKSAMSLEKRISVMDDMVRWARQMGALPGPEPLDGIDNDIRLAGALRALGTAGTARGGA
jgi:hypothetical protein